MEAAATYHHSIHRPTGSNHINSMMVISPDPSCAAVNPRSVTNPSVLPHPHSMFRAHNPAQGNLHPYFSAPQIQHPLSDRFIPFNSLHARPITAVTHNPYITPPIDLTMSAFRPAPKRIRVTESPSVLPTSETQDLEASVVPDDKDIEDRPDSTTVGCVILTGVSASDETTTINTSADNINITNIDEDEEFITTSPPCTDNNYYDPDLRRSSKRCKKASPLGNELCCPVCGVTVLFHELLTHYNTEINRLDKLSNRSGKRTPPSRKRVKDVGDHDKCLETYHRIKANRLHRLNTRCNRTRSRRKTDDEDGLLCGVSGDTTTMCPICREVIHGNQTEVSLHVESCLRKYRVCGDASGNEDEIVDVETGENVGERFEVYSWAGQTRVRASSLIQRHQYSGYGYEGNSAVCDSSEGGDLDVERDLCNVYGRVQYTESDIIPCLADHPELQPQQEQLRDAVITGLHECPVERRPPSSNSSKWTNDAEQQDEADSSDHMIKLSADNSTLLLTDSGHVTENKLAADNCAETESDTVIKLRKRISDFESELKNISERHKCLICMESYSCPVVSIVCWHVHCEECWLRTLGAKKLCPQCNMITSPTHLRRVYL